VEAGQQRCLGVFAVMFCGMAGFSDFYKLRWLEAILSWQNPQVGCFGRPGELPVCPSWEHCLVGVPVSGSLKKKDILALRTGDLKQASTHMGLEGIGILRA
jgi:hypothetical protein